MTAVLARSLCTAVASRRDWAEIGRAWRTQYCWKRRSAAPHGVCRASDHVSARRRTEPRRQRSPRSPRRRAVLRTASLACACGFLCSGLSARAERQVGIRGEGSVPTAGYYTGGTSRGNASGGSDPVGHRHPGKPYEKGGNTPGSAGQGLEDGPTNAPGSSPAGSPRGGNSSGSAMRPAPPAPARVRLPGTTATAGSCRFPGTGGAAEVGYRRPVGDVDAVVIGAGPNGLVAANLLADAGWRVLVLEAQPEPGGAVRSAELTHPGFVHDVCSAFYPLGVASPVMRVARPRVVRVALALRARSCSRTRRPTAAAPRCRPTSTRPRRRSTTFAPGDGDAWRDVRRRLPRG